MYIYKYLHEDRIEDILEHNLLRFTQPKEFNDPFELRPLLKFVSDESILNNDIESNFESTIKKEYDENTQINQKMSFDTFLTFASTKKNEVKSLMKNVLLSKEWEYENEYRVFMHLDKADQIKNNNIYLYKFSPDVIKSIYLGANISEENKSKLLTLLNQDKLKHIKINQFHISEELFELKFESIR